MSLVGGYHIDQDRVVAPSRNGKITKEYTLLVVEFFSYRVGMLLWVQQERCVRPLANTPAKEIVPEYLAGQNIDLPGP